MQVFFGSNCVRNGKCTYTSFGVYVLDEHVLRNKSVTSTSLSVTDRQLVGSARHFAPSLDAEVSERLFAFAFARDCGGTPFCATVGADVVPLHKQWLTVYRTYLEPSTKTGPLATELVLPRSLVFASPSLVS